MNQLEPDTVRAALRRLMDERGVDMATVSRAIGKNHAYIQQFMTRGVPAELGYKTAMALATYFGCAPHTFGIDMPAPVRPSNDSMRHPLHDIRRLAGLSPEQMARALGESEDTLRAIESGRAGLSEKLLLKICRTFQIDPDDLAGYAPAMTPDERVMLLRLRGLTPAQRSALDNLLVSFEKERA